MSYAKQMRSIAGYDRFLCSLTCCNGKVYALNTGRSHFLVIHINIVVKDRETRIRLLPYLKVPSYYINGCLSVTFYLKGCCGELFFIGLGYKEVGHMTNKTIGGVRVFKLDITNKRWEEMEDLKDAAFFLDLAHDYLVFYSPEIASDLGGYAHFLDSSGKVIHSYNVKNKTIALSSMPTSHASSLEHRLPGDHGENKSQQEEEDKENEMVVRDGEVGSNCARIEENMESRLLNVPFDVLKTIMEFCVGVEYLNFRATCKQCHLGAPMIRLSNRERLQKYSLVSPWLMVLHKDRGIVSFTDPRYGDNYFIKTPRELIGDLEIHCSVCGWLLIRRREGPLMFFNPFTCDVCELPYGPYLDSYCFSSPPTSSDCMVVGFTTSGEWHVYIHFVARGPCWRRFHLNFCGDDSDSFHFATLYGQNRYALYNNGGLNFIDTDNEEYTWRKVLAEGPSSSCGSPKQNFLMKFNQQLLLVVASKFGDSVEVFILNDSMEWEKIESLGRHTIYIGNKTCLCIEAKTPEIVNKIYFSCIHSKNRKIVFYSLETRMYHTYNIEESFRDFMGTEHHLDPHVWIEPCWS